MRRPNLVPLRHIGNIFSTQPAGVKLQKSDAARFTFIFRLWTTPLACNVQPPFSRLAPQSPGGRLSFPFPDQVHA
jgi:hypothetical protein